MQGGFNLILKIGLLHLLFDLLLKNQIFILLLSFCKNHIFYYFLYLYLIKIIKFFLFFQCFYCLFLITKKFLFCWENFQSCDINTTIIIWIWVNYGLNFEDFTNLHLILMLFQKKRKMLLEFQILLKFIEAYFRIRFQKLIQIAINLLLF